MNAIAPITVRAITRPQYMNAPVTLESFQRWFICNHTALKGFWQQLEQLGDEPSDFLTWAQCQYDIAKIESPSSAETARESQQAQRQKDDSADLGSVEVGDFSNYDGAPYCSHCGAKKARWCTCGGIADNE